MHPAHEYPASPDTSPSWHRHDPGMGESVAVDHLVAALDRARAAARRYESLRPGDGRLTSVLALVAPRLERTRRIPRRTLVAALQVARTCEAETGGTAAASAAAVVAMAAAALALDEGLPLPRVAALAGAPCGRAPALG